MRLLDFLRTWKSSGKKEVSDKGTQCSASDIDLASDQKDTLYDNSTPAGHFRGSDESLSIDQHADSMSVSRCNSSGELVLESPQCAQMDSLVAKTYRNLNESHLLRLPDELLLKIMNFCNLETFRALRKSSRRFLYLFAANEFKNYHQYPPRVGYRHEMWPVIKPPLSKRSNSEAETNAEASRIGYCDPCLDWLENRLTKDLTSELEYYHCSGCNSDHHARLFSAKELSKTPKDRICIGRQGYVSLCAHLDISYADILEAQAGGSGHRRILECLHSSHDFAPDHSYGGELVDVYVSEANQPDETPPHSCKVKRQHLSFAKASHANFGASQGTRPTAQQFRDFLRELQRVSPTPWYCLDNPSLTPLRKMDPNKCHCFDYQGSDLVRWPLRPNPPEEATCESLWLGIPRYQNEPRCNDRAHSETQGFRHFKTDFSLGLHPCNRPAEHACMMLNYWRSFDFCHPWESQWIYSLNPTSYGNLEFTGHFPCTSRQCRNFMKYETYGPFFACLGEDAETERQANRECGEQCQAK